MQTDLVTVAMETVILNLIVFSKGVATQPHETLRSTRSSASEGEETESEALCVFIQRGKYLVRIIIFPSAGRSPCEICTGKWSCYYCLLGGRGASTINLRGVASRITTNTSLIRCLYSPNEIYIYVTCKLFHTSNVNVLTEEVDVTPEALSGK